MKSYHSKPLGAAPPHVYAIADTAYRALNTENTDQAVMIRHVPVRWISRVKLLAPKIASFSIIIVGRGGHDQV